MTTHTQPTLFVLEETASTQAVELFPGVWTAAEALVAPDAPVRHAALDNLIDLGASRISPLIAYLLVTRLAEPDISLRKRIIKTLADVLTFDLEGNPAPDEVRQYLYTHLSQMRRRQIYAILQVAAEEIDLRPSVARLLSACSYAGDTLIDILGDRKAPLSVRQQAVYFIGEVGFLDAVSFLERLANRLDSRINGQKSMSFAPALAAVDAALLPDIKDALKLLSA